MILPIRFLLYQREDEGKYNIIREKNELKFHHPGKRVVHIEYTIYTFDFNWIETIEECVFLRCNIKSMEILRPSRLGTDCIFRKCIFYDCTIDSMEIQGLKDISEIYFINCKIQNIELNDVYATETYFMDCSINNSTFENSILPGLTFSKFEKKAIKGIIDKVLTGDVGKALEAKTEILEYSCKSKRDSCIRRSEFLFCELNDLSISGTDLAETDLKHSYLGRPKITDNVRMKDISLWGTKIAGGLFKNCFLKDIQIKKGVFLPQLVRYFFREIINIMFFFISHLFTQRFKRKFRKKNFLQKFKGKVAFIRMNRKAITIKKWLKTRLYKLPFVSVLADWLSSTEISQTDFDGVDFSQDPFLARQIDEFEVIHSIKKKHPLLAYFFLISSNYMRSFWRLIFVSLFFIWIFSGIYSRSSFVDDIQTNRDYGYRYDFIDKFSHPQHPFHLSIDIYLGITIYPLKAKDKTTKAWIIVERILGYGALASFMSILLAPLALAHYKRKKEDDAKIPPGRH